MIVVDIGNLETVVKQNLTSGGLRIIGERVNVKKIK